MPGLRVKKLNLQGLTPQNNSNGSLAKSQLSSHSLQYIHDEKHAKNSKTILLTRAVMILLFCAIFALALIVTKLIFEDGASSSTNTLGKNLRNEIAQHVSVHTSAMLLEMLVNLQETVSYAQMGAIDFTSVTTLRSIRTFLASQALNMNESDIMGVCNAQMNCVGVRYHYPGVPVPSGFYFESGYGGDPNNVALYIMDGTGFYVGPVDVRGTFNEMLTPAFAALAVASPWKGENSVRRHIRWSEPFSTSFENNTHIMLITDLTHTLSNGTEVLQGYSVNEMSLRGINNLFTTVAKSIASYNTRVFAIDNGQRLISGTPPIDDSEEAKNEAILLTGDILNTTKASESRISWVASAYNRYEELFGVPTMDRLKSEGYESHFEVTINGETHYASTIGLNSDVGLNWLIFVVMPVSAVMGEFEDAVETSSIVATVVGVVGLLLWVAMAFIVTQPMKKLMVKQQVEAERLERQNRRYANRIERMVQIQHSSELDVEAPVVRAMHILKELQEDSPSDELFEVLCLLQKGGDIRTQDWRRYVRADDPLGTRTARAHSQGERKVDVQTREWLLSTFGSAVSNNTATTASEGNLEGDDGNTQRFGHGLAHISEESAGSIPLPPGVAKQRTKSEPPTQGISSGGLASTTSTPTTDSPPTIPSGEKNSSQKHNHMQKGQLTDTMPIGSGKTAPLFGSHGESKMRPDRHSFNNLSSFNQDTIDYRFEQEIQRSENSQNSSVKPNDPEYSRNAQKPYQRSRSASVSLASLVDNHSHPESPRQGPAFTSGLIITEEGSSQNLDKDFPSANDSSKLLNREESNLSEASEPTIKGSQHTFSTKNTIEASIIRFHKPIFDDCVSYIKSHPFQDFSAFTLGEISNGQPLTMLSLAFFRQTGLLQVFQIPERTLLNFVGKIEAHYLPNPYHNKYHACEVLYCVKYLLTQRVVAQKMDLVELVSAFVAAIVHDVGHPGVNNAFLNSIGHMISVRYNDTSSLENFHLCTSFTLLSDANCNIFANINPGLAMKIRQRIISMVLATDMSKHFDIVGQFTLRNAADAYKNAVVEEEDRVLALNMAIKLADLGHLLKHADIGLTWVQKINDEFFSQGDKERALRLPLSAFMDRAEMNVPKSQIGFLDFVCLPLFKAWDECFSTTLQLNIAEKREMWNEWLQEEKKNIPQQYLTDVKADISNHSSISSSGFAQIIRELLQREVVLTNELTENLNTSLSTINLNQAPSKVFLPD